MHMPVAPLAKAALRAEALARRDSLQPATRASASAAIAERAIAVIASVRPRCVAAYLPFGSEVDPGAILTWAAANDIATVVPAMVDAATMVFRAYRPGDPLGTDAFGIEAPSAEAPTYDPDLIMAPLSAFDRNGHRVGKGLGFYDRIVASLRAKGHTPLLLGVAFAVQEVGAIPHEPHDVRVDWVVTERETMAFRRAD